MVPSDFKSPVELESPFKMLAHHWTVLDDHRRSPPIRERAAHMIENNQIAYDNAWVPFQPGDLLYSEVGGHPWLLLCEKTAYEEDKEKGNYFEVQCTYSDHNGTYAGESTRVFKMFQKEYFPADNPAVITDLPVYPLSFVKNSCECKEGGGLRDRLKKRGERFLALPDQSTMTYTGAAEFLQEPPTAGSTRRRASGAASGCPTRRRAASCSTARRSARSTPRRNPPCGRWGRARRWTRCCARRRRSGTPSPRKRGASCLSTVLTRWSGSPTPGTASSSGEKEKLVLRSLVTSHQYSDRARDQMLQKGKGLVMLLHGAPGSGKTLTAEIAAEGTKKALIMTSVGELNKNNYAVLFERELKKVLRYATTWKAIVLLDEADVFLEARENSKNPDKNSLVAVLLKELEYFSGIVFLTTNRVESFDTAMKSRIHLSLGYHPPEQAVRRRIWTLCLQGVPAEESDIHIPNNLDRHGNDGEALEHLVSSALNGREISNAVNTARTIARFEEKRLQWGHIRTVLEVRSAFDVKVQGKMAQ
ncbi:hypothetical protein PG990_001670 [Apiospora arundinis]